MRITAIGASVLVLCMASFSFAQNGMPAVYTDGTVRGLSKDASGTLRVDGEDALTFAGRKANWTTPYPQIKTIYVSLSRRSALSEAFGLGGAAIGAAKKRKLLLSLIITDAQGKSARAVFSLPGSAPDGFASALEQKSGKKIVFESEEARVSFTMPEP